MRHNRTKIEGGSGGKRGHSNMTHWEYTEEIKRRTRKARRAEVKAIEKASVHSDHSQKTMKINLPIRRVVAPSPQGSTGGTSSALLAVNLHDDEDVEWIWTHDAKGSYVSGYRIVEKTADFLGSI